MNRKDASIWPEYPAGKWMGKLQNYREAQILFAGIELDIFSLMENPVSAEALAEERGWDTRNCRLFLDALTSVGYVEKDENLYRNMPDTDCYLNRKSELYLGDYLMFWKEITSLEDAAERVRTGPEKDAVYKADGSDSYDFRKMAKMAKTEMYTGRVQAFLAAMKECFEKEQKIRMMDLGGGSGVMTAEFLRCFENARGWLMDQPSVTGFTAEVMEEYGVAKRCQIVDGDFKTDPIGTDYDLIVASGIFDFVGDPAKMAKKIAAALRPGGLLYLDTHKVSDDKTQPASCILGWLSTHLNGLDILQTDRSIVTGVEQAGLEKFRNAPQHAFTGYIYQKPESKER